MYFDEKAIEFDPYRDYVKWNDIVDATTTYAAFALMYGNPNNRPYTTF